MRTVFHHVKLKNWFPADDIIATNVVRLCILKEDLELEYRGYLEPQIQPLDVNEISWRKIYFFRNIFRTMLEIDSVIHSLKMNHEFQRALSNQPIELKDSFDALSQNMLNAHDLIKKYRNCIGGHVQEKTIVNALKNLSSERTSFISCNVTRNLVNLNFTSELCMAVFFDEHPEEIQLDKAEEIISKLKSVIPFNAISAVITTYVRERGLIKK